MFGKERKIIPPSRAMAAAERVIRVRRTDSDGDYLLLNTLPSGVKDLDLKLVASEGDHVYLGKIRDSSIKSLQASALSGDLEEWRTILTVALLQERPAPQPETLQGLETVANINKGSVTITIRKNFSGVHSRLGSIQLEQNDAEADNFNLFDWASTAAGTADVLREQIANLQASVGTRQAEVAKLNRQLEDLVKAKREHEGELLKKFAALLNAKKLKIRDQQRLLAGVKVDPRAAQAVKTSRGAKGVGTSRKRKRTANGADPESELELEGQEAEGEDENVDEDAVDERMREQQSTPEPMEDDATESDGDSEGFSAPPPPTSLNRGKEAGAGFDRRSPPPRRELPFAKQPAAPPPKLVAPADDEETDDEEL